MFLAFNYSNSYLQERCNSTVFSTHPPDLICPDSHVGLRLGAVLTDHVGLLHQLQDGLPLLGDSKD